MKPTLTALLLLPLALSACAPGAPNAAGPASQGGAPRRVRVGFLGVFEDAQAEPVTLSKVLPGSAASAAGLAEKDVIRGVDGKPVTSFQQIADAVKASPGKPLKLKVLRQGKEREVTVIPQGRPADSEAVRQAFGLLMTGLKNDYPQAQKSGNWSPLKDPCLKFARDYAGTDSGAAASAYAIQFSASALTPAEVLKQAEAWALTLPHEPALNLNEFGSLSQAYFGTPEGDKADRQAWIEGLGRIAVSAKEPNLAAAAHAQAAVFLMEAGKDAEALKHADAAVAAAPQSEGGQQAAEFCYEIRHLSVGMPAPDFRSPTLDGKEVALSALKGRPVLLCYWASW